MDKSWRFSGITAVAVLLAFCFALASGCTGEQPYVEPTGEDKAAEALDSLKSGVFLSLSDTLGLAEDTSKELTKIDRNQTEVNSRLRDSQQSLSWVESVAFITPNGTVAAVEPDTYSDLVGKDLSYQDIVLETISTQEPVMSNYMLLEEGEWGTLIEYPVFSKEGEFAGFISVCFSPAELIEPYAEAVKSKYGYSVMVAQPDGLVLYDEDPEEIGVETFGNPMYEAYPEVLAFAEAYSSSPSGKYEYTYKETGSDEVVAKEAFWESVGILGNEWRLVVIKEA